MPMAKCRYCDSAIMVFPDASVTRMWISPTRSSMGDVAHPRHQTIATGCDAASRVPVGRPSARRADLRPRDALAPVLRPHQSAGRGGRA
jgi:hypothetical protein